MFGFWQIVIVAVIVLILFNYKRLPGLGRSAGEGVNQLKGSANEMIGDHKMDPTTLGKSAGKGMREFREFKDALTGAGETKPATRARPAAAEPETAADESDSAPATDEQPHPYPEAADTARPEAEEPERVEGELVNGTRPA